MFIAFQFVELLTKSTFFSNFDFKAMATSSKRKRSGGIRQRLAAEDLHAQLPETSRLGNFLLDRWSWGLASVQEVQQTADLAIQDMKDFGCPDLPADLVFLQGLGSGGRHANNMHRDLLKKMADESSMCQPTITNIPLKQGSVPHSFLLPHEAFSCLYHQHPESFWRLLIPGGQDQLAHFWSRFADHPALKESPLLSQPNFQKKTVPLNFHGDGVPTAGKGKVWCKMLLVLSWCSCLAQGSTKDVCNLCYAVLCQNLISTSFSEYVVRRFFYVLDNLQLVYFPDNFVETCLSICHFFCLQLRYTKL